MQLLPQVLGNVIVLTNKMHDYIFVIYCTKEKNETFCVSEYEERNKKSKRFRFLRSIISYVPLVLKFLM